MTSNTTNRVGIIDVLIFGGLESLGICAVLGNLALIVVLLKNKYLHRASFILMLNLAIADVVHGFVTTCHFYPPIVLKKMHIGELGIRLFNIADWTAWAITLTHMSAICLDRLIAIILYSRYNVIVTIQRIRNFSLTCWVVFLSTNATFFFLHACCMIRPLESLNYYSFGYIETERFNVYVLTYTPVEIITILILTFSNPITLVQLYRRHKRKIALRQQGAQSSSTSSSLLKAQRSQWQRASTMLLEMSMKMGSKQINNDVREIAARRANRQQQRILLQITVVALIFYGYMTAYYISYYSRWFQSTAAMIFNSYFYSTTHMINPVIYFSLNKEMRAQFREAIKDFLGVFDCKKKDPYGFATNSTKINHSTRATIEIAHPSTSYSETSPLFSSAHHYKSTCETGVSHNKGDSSNSNSPGTDSAEIRRIVSGASDNDQSQCSLPHSDLYGTPLGDLPNNKMNVRERSAFITQLVSALQYSSSKSLSRLSNVCEIRRGIDKSATTNDISGAAKKRYIRFSKTLQFVSREAIDSVLPPPCNPSRYMSVGSLENTYLLSESLKTSSSGSNLHRFAAISRSSTSSSRAIIAGIPISEDNSSDDEIAYL